MSERRRPDLGPIYGIADADLISAGSAVPRSAVPAGSPGTVEALVAAVAAIAAAGVRTIQVRAKRLDGRQWYAAVEGCCRALAGSGVHLWVDDRADIAALFPVAGLHLGQRDLPPAAARQVIGDSPWIGLSTHNEQQLLAANADPAVDLIAVGPIFETAGKADPDPVVGLDFLRWARARTAKPLAAIGGIDAERVAAVLRAGADAAVALGAVCRGDLRANCHRLLAAAAIAGGAAGGDGAT
jgi:thiamine-phosphate pyrophosphorylase